MNNGWKFIVNAAAEKTETMQIVMMIYVSWVLRKGSIVDGPPMTPTVYQNF
jgi:hypothetical protein